MSTVSGKGVKSDAPSEPVVAEVVPEETPADTIEQQNRVFTKKVLRIIAIVVCAAAICGVFYGLWSVMAETAKPTYYPSARTLITSAKISEMDGYKRVYADENSDYAVFVRVSYSANQLGVGTWVNIGNAKGTVSETHDTYFNVAINISTCLPGTVVYAGGEAVGFVSSMNAGTAVCTYY